MSKQLFSLLILLLFTCNEANCQDSKRYTIITYEQTVKPSQHGKKDYYWIMPTDSMSGKEINLAPFYFDKFDTNALKKCQKGISPNLFVITTESDYNFSREYNNDINSSQKIVLTHRRKVQVILKKWPDGHREKIIVYATPIIGNMCQCVMTGYDSMRSGYEGKFYMALSDFLLDNKLWNDNKMFYNLVLRDYNRFNVGTGY